MKTLFRFAFLVLLVTGWGLAAMSVHVLRTPDRISFIPKEEMSPFDSYVDTRMWTLDDAADHPAVVAKLVRANRQTLLSHVVDPASRRDLRVQLIEAVERGPRRRVKPAPEQSVGGEGGTVASVVKMIDWSSFGFGK